MSLKENKIKKPRAQPSADKGRISRDRSATARKRAATKREDSAPIVEVRDLVNGAISLRCGDCRDALKSIPDNSIDAVVTDPPYAIDSILKRFGAESATAAGFGSDGAFARLSQNFMGRKWDVEEAAFSVDLWREVMRVLKPGGAIVAMCSGAKYHKLGTAIERAGGEIVETIGWIYSTGQVATHYVARFLEAANVEPEIVAEWRGWSTKLKPALEPIVRARKPLGKLSLANAAVQWGTGCINVGACANGERYPSNVLHDGSDDVLDAFPVAAGESTSRFFYSPKAGDDDRFGFAHPTIKPVELKRWLVRLTARRGAVVLDPFAGTGTTGQAAIYEGCRAVLIEREPDYQAMIEQRMKLALAGPEEKRRALTKPAPVESAPLFEARS